MTGHAGWPMTCVLTPDGAPFFAGTFFPREQFGRLLTAITELWRDGSRRRRSTPGSGCSTRWPALARADGEPGGRRSVRRSRRGRRPAGRDVRLGARRLRRRAEVPAVDGARIPAAGTTSAPAQPMLAGDGRRAPARRWPAAGCTTSSAAASPATASTPTGSCRTSRRCSTTTRCCCAPTCTGGGAPATRSRGGSPPRRPTSCCATCARPRAASRRRSTPTPTGSKGPTYVWTPAQLVDVLGPADGAYAAAAVRGHRRRARSSTARRRCSCRAIPTTPQRWARHPRAPVRGPRARARSPARDDKVVTSWNGLAIGALAEASELLRDPRYLDAAVDAATLLLERASGGRAAAADVSRRPGRRGCRRGRRLRQPGRGTAGPAPGDAPIRRGWSRPANCSTSRWRISPTATAASTTPPTMPSSWCAGRRIRPTMRRRRAPVRSIAALGGLFGADRVAVAPGRSPTARCRPGRPTGGRAAALLRLGARGGRGAGSRAARRSRSWARGRAAR